MSNEDMRWFQIHEENPDAEPPALAFTADDLAERFPNGMEPEDVEAMNLAMDRDMRDRNEFLRDQIAARDERIEALERELAQERMAHGQDAYAVTDETLHGLGDFDGGEAA